MQREPHDPMKIPFVFSNMQCTQPTNKKLAEWCLWACINHPEILKFLHTAGQEYIRHGGCGVYTFARWQSQLQRNCKKYLEEKK